MAKMSPSGRRIQFLKREIPKTFSPRSQSQPVSRGIECRQTHAEGQMPVRAIDHILIAMRLGERARPELFIRVFRELTEIAKPAQLAARCGGCDM
jgi:hypothetical protein